MTRSAQGNSRSRSACTLAFHRRFLADVRRRESVSRASLYACPRCGVSWVPVADGSSFRRVA